MKSILILILGIAGTLPQARAYTGTGTLNLTTGATDNKLNITIGASASGFTASDTDTTTISGSLYVTVDSNPQTGATTVFTIDGGNVAMTDMNFNLRVIVISVAKISTLGMRGTAFTPLPPGIVTPTANGGTFDAAQHHLRINEGDITGEITPPGSAATTIDTNFTAAPVEGPGTGTGTLTVVPGTSSSTHRNCTVTMLLPVDFTDTQDLDGTAVTVQVQGTIKATGIIPIPLNSWVDWTIDNDLTGAGFTTSTAPGNAPLGLAWAMGYEPDTPAAVVTPVMVPGTTPTARFDLPAGGSRAPLTLEQSDSLTTASWQTVPAAEVSSGQNPVPTGTTGTVTVQWTNPAANRFLRIKANQP
ncbi:MAG: hypothetical protein K9N23_18850 [Akkermansiaceae bacterium]|nr:hypothetical protein [Akkermansiaceae bacterium]MCF7733755.1 hypothetical protein [Akkermansiaceae bacterium]